MTAACPLCGSTDARTVYELTASEAARNWASDQHEPEAHGRLAQHIRSLWGQDTGASMECRACGFNYAYPFVAGDATFYELAFGPSGYPADKWEFDRTTEALATSGVPADAAALEVGSGYGFFLDKVSPRFFAPANVTSIEYNPTAREKLSRKGFRVLTDDLDELVARNERYSAAFMFQVLEHRDRPHEIFAAFRNLLEPGGQLFIAVPYLPSVRFWEEHGALVDVPPNHIGFFSEQNLAALGEKHGFRLCAVEKEPFNLPLFLKWDAYFAYLRKAQTGMPVVSQLYANRRKPGMRVLNLLAVLALAPFRLPTWLAALRRKDEMSLHIWAHFQRT